MYCKPKINNGSVVIYYGVQGVMRFPTGVKISKDKDRNKKFKEWDYKNNRVRVEVSNSTDMNNVINDWLNKADNIVSDYLRDGATITAKELNENLNNIKNGKTKVKTSLLLDHYDDFMERKRMQLVERENKSDVSFKTYGTFRNTIKDYEAEHQVTLKNSDITNNDWLTYFHTWLTRSRPKENIIDGKVYKFKTKGNLKPASIDKRFEVLTGYFSYLKEKSLLQDDSFLKKYKRNEIIVLPKVKTTLSVYEIHKLYNHEFVYNTWEEIKLIFLFSCLTGFRWKDIENFNKDFIIEENGYKVYKHIAHKTKSKTGRIAKIPLAKLAMSILEKLDYKLNRYKNATCNKELHKLLHQSNLFNDITLAQDGTGRQLKRYEIITMHRGRDTFITNLINTVPLHELMSYTSHEKLSTLQKYIDYTREINPEYVSIFDQEPNLK